MKWITFSLFPQYSYVLASAQCENCTYNDKSFPAIPYCWGLLEQSGLGSGYPTTQARATLQLAIREF
jgi:hypothetical protein